MPDKKSSSFSSCKVALKKENKVYLPNFFRLYYLFHQKILWIFTALPSFRMCKSDFAISASLTWNGKVLFAQMFVQETNLHIGIGKSRIEPNFSRRRGQQQLHNTESLYRSRAEQMRKSSFDISRLRTPVGTLIRALSSLSCQQWGDWQMKTDPLPNGKESAKAKRRFSPEITDDDGNDVVSFGAFAFLAPANI